MKRIFAELLGRKVGYEPKIIIHLGINANSKDEAREKAEKHAEIIKIKLGEYLSQFPSWIEVKD